MDKKFGLKVVALNVLVVILLIFGVVSTGYAGGGQGGPEGSRETGRAINAVLTATLMGTNEGQFVQTVLVGSCDGIDFGVGPIVNVITPFNFYDVTPESLVDQLVDVNIPECHDGDLVVIRVNDFYKSDEFVGAGIVLKRLTFN